MSTEKLAANQLETLLRGACAQLDRRLRGGEDCRAEEWFVRHPALAQNADLAIELAYTEFVTREDLGQEPKQADWYDRFPQWRERLERLFTVHAELGNEATSIGSSVNVTWVGPPGGRPMWQDASPPGYEIIEQLGRGGMGVVYKARQLGLNRLVALKMIRGGAFASQYELKRFSLEGEAVARLQHANVVQVFEVGEHRGLPYLAMEYVEGGSLADLLRFGNMAPREAATLVAQLASAVHAAHLRGIVHRDLKPANVLLGGVVSGGVVSGDDTASHAHTPLTTHQRHAPLTTHPLTTHQPKITDFGLAKFAEETGGHTAPGAVLGTPSYMAPEQAAGKSRDVGPAADTYALGAILYELLTGRPPFEADTQVETLHRVRFEDALPPQALDPKLPRDLDVICVKCLRKEPKDRYASAQDLANELDRFLKGEPILARPVSWFERTAMWVRRRPAIAALLAISAILFLLILGQGWWSYLALRSSAREVEASLHEALNAVDAMLVEVGDVELADVPLMDQKRRVLLEKAEAFFKRFLERHGESSAVRFEAARAYVRLGEIQSLLGDAAAQGSLAEGLKQLESLPETPDQQREISRALHSLGVHQKDLGQLEAAERNLETASQLREMRLAGAWSAEAERDAAESTYQLGAAYAKTPAKVAKAKECYTRAIDHWKNAYETGGRLGMARVHNNYGLLIVGHEPETALRYFDNAAAHFPPADDGTVLPPAQRRLQARIMANQAATHERLGQVAEARRAYTAAIAVLDDVLRSFPDHVGARQDLVAVLLNTGQLADEAGDQQATTHFDRAIKESQSLIKLAPHLPAHHQRLASTWLRVANYRQMRSQFPEAEEAYRQSRAAYDALLRLAPGQAEHAMERGQCLLARTRFLLTQKAFDQARACALEAFADFRTAQRLAPALKAHGANLQGATWTMALIHLGLGDHAAAALAGEEVPQFGVDPVGEFIAAGYCLAQCAGLARDDARLSSTDRERLQAEYGQRAVHWLRKAVERGYHDANEFRTNKKLDPIRGRQDFIDLLKDLGAKTERTIG